MEEKDREVILLSLEDIVPNRFQPRLNFDEKELDDLAISIKRYGIIQPIVVRRLGDKYEIIAGERRFKASTIAGLTKIPCIIMDTDDDTSAEIALLENLQRKNLTPIEEAQSYKKLMERGLTQDVIAGKLGISQPSVANKIRLLNLPEKVHNALLYNKISERHARCLLTLENEDLQNNLLDKIINERLTVRQTEEEINFIKNKDKINEEPLPVDLNRFLNPELTALEPVIENMALDGTDNEIKQEQTSEIVQKNIDEEKDIIDEVNSLNNFSNPNLNELLAKEEIKENVIEEIETLDFKVPEVIDIDEPKIEDTPLEENISLDSTDMNPFQDDSVEEAMKVLEESRNSFEENITENINENLQEVIDNEPIVVSNEETNEYETVSLDDSLKEEIINEEIKAEHEVIRNNFAPYEPELEQFNDTVEDEEEEELSLPVIINKIRDLVSNINSGDEKLTVEELDFPENYQITINIRKDIM